MTARRARVTCLDAEHAHPSREGGAVADDHAGGVAVADAGGHGHRGGPDRAGHGGHGTHAGHHTEQFRRRFWWSLLLSIPVVLTSPMVMDWFGYELDFAGIDWVGPVLG
jgi:Cu2+-exporting ATPase